MWIRIYCPLLSTWAMINLLLKHWHSLYVHKTWIFYWHQQKLSINNYNFILIISSIDLWKYKIYKCIIVTFDCSNKTGSLLETTAHNPSLHFLTKINWSCSLLSTIECFLTCFSHLSWCASANCISNNASLSPILQHK